MNGFQPDAHVGSGRGSGRGRVLAELVDVLFCELAIPFLSGEDPRGVALKRARFVFLFYPSVSVPVCTSDTEQCFKLSECTDNSASGPSAGLEVQLVNSGNQVSPPLPSPNTHTHTHTPHYRLCGRMSSRSGHLPFL